MAQCTHTFAAHAIMFLQIRYGFHCCVENGYDLIELIFVDLGMKVNGQYSHDVLLSQQMLPAIKHVAGDTFVFQQEWRQSSISLCQGHH